VRPGAPPGSRLVAQESHHNFGVDLVGQVYQLPLAG
jgi:hypothetical protein